MIKNNIKRIRQRSGLSQTKLARLAGLSEPALSELELNKRQAWPKARRSIANALGVNESELFPGLTDKD